LIFSDAECNGDLLLCGGAVQWVMKGQSRLWDGWRVPISILLL